MEGFDSTSQEAEDHGAIFATEGDAGDVSLIILQSLLCLLREKNLLTRGDIETLAKKVERRAAGKSQIPLSCRHEAAVSASCMMQQLGSYMGHRYGGKHARGG